MYTVLGLGSVDPKIVRPILGEQVVFIDRPTDDDFAAADGVIVRAAYQIDRPALARMPKLKVVARTGVGTELVDLVATEELGIPVVITPGSNTHAVAEGAMAHLLHLVKRLGPLTRLVADGDWARRESFPVGDLEGQTLGVVGFGRIGQKVAQLGEAFGMRVIAFDPFAKIPDSMAAEDLQALVSASDAISLHVPLTAETNKMVNSSLLAEFKPGAVLVNCGRGSLLDLDAVLAALNSGALSGVGLDVFDPEPPAHHPLFDHENVVLTPHVMGLSKKATEATFVMAAQGVRDVLEGRQPQAIATGSVWRGK